MADTPTCRKCGVALTSTHVVLRVCYEGGSPFKNTATRRLAATYGVPEEIRACLDCGVAIGQSLQADDPQE